MTKLNMKNSAVKRLMSEYKKDFAKREDPTIHAAPCEDNLFEWHFTIRGAKDTVYEGGIYHGKLLLPSDYPFKPPDLEMLTPSGRFQVNTRVCLSITTFHPDHWQPSWGIRTILVALQAFFVSPANGAVGSIETSSRERKLLAGKSRTHKCTLCDLTNEEILPDSDDNTISSSSSSTSSSTSSPDLADDTTATTAAAAAAAAATASTNDTAPEAATELAPSPSQDELSDTRDVTANTQESQTVSVESQGVETSSTRSSASQPASPDNLETTETRGGTLDLRELRRRWSSERSTNTLQQKQNTAATIHQTEASSTVPEPQKTEPPSSTTTQINVTAIQEAQNHPPQRQPQPQHEHDSQPQPTAAEQEHAHIQTQTQAQAQDQEQELVQQLTPEQIEERRQRQERLDRKDRIVSQLIVVLGIIIAIVTSRKAMRFIGAKDKLFTEDFEYDPSDFDSSF